jgi:hypothetical protein
MFRRILRPAVDPKEGLRNGVFSTFENRAFVRMLGESCLARLPFGPQCRVGARKRSFAHEFSREKRTGKIVLWDAELRSFGALKP